MNNNLNQSGMFDHETMFCANLLQNMHIFGPLVGHK